MADDDKSYWVPLESNPAALTKFAHKVGVPSSIVFSDCIGLDEALLPFLPQPVYAFVLLFPYSAMRALKGDELPSQPADVFSPKLFYMKQLVGNACGTVAVVHALANNMERLGINDGFLKRFVERMRDATPTERGAQFGRLEELKAVHETIAADEEANQTDAPEADAKVDYHFVCITQVDNKLYELDGAKAGPIYHGASSPETFVTDAAKVITEQFINKLSGNIMFSLLVLGPEPAEL